jgi:hypothetical protein
MAPVPLVLALAATAPASDDSVRVQDFSIADVHPILSEGTVQVKGFQLVPMAYHEGTLQLHPKFEAGVAEDSNVYADNTNRKQDQYLDSLAGVQGQIEFDENSRTYTDCEVEARDFRTEHNREALVARLYGQYEQDISNGSQVMGTAAYVRSDDPLVESGYEVDHGEAAGGAQYSYDGLASRITLRADYENARFYTGDSFFVPHAMDYDVYRATALYGFRKGEYSEFILRASADQFHYLNQDQFESSHGGSALAGWRGAFLPKLTGTVGAGIEVRQFTHPFNQDPNYNDKRVARPIGVASITWEIEEGTTATLRSWSELMPSEVSNAVWYYGVAGSGRYRLLINSALFGSVEISHQRESGTPAGLPLEQRDNRSLSAGIEYFLREGVGTRFYGEFDDSHSRDYNTFTRWTAHVELAVAY